MALEPRTGWSRSKPWPMPGWPRGTKDLVPGQAGPQEALFWASQEQRLPRLLMPSLQGPGQGPPVLLVLELPQQPGPFPPARCSQLSHRRGEGRGVAVLITNTSSLRNTLPGISTSTPNDTWGGGDFNLHFIRRETEVQASGTGQECSARQGPNAFACVLLSQASADRLSCCLVPGIQAQS